MDLDKKLPFKHFLQQTGVCDYYNMLSKNLESHLPSR